MKNFQILIVFLLLGIKCAYGADRLVSTTVVEGKYGIEAEFATSTDTKLVFYTLTFSNVGYSYDPSDKGGLSDFMVSVLNEGNTKKNSVEFARTLGKLGGDISYSVESDSITVTISSPRENVEKVFEQFISSIASPRVDQATISKVRGIKLSELQAAEGNIRYVAGRELSRELTKSNVWYMGTIQSISSISGEDIKAHISNVFTRMNMKVMVVGNTSYEQIKSILDEHLIEFPLTVMEVHGASVVPFSPASSCVSVPMDNSQNVIMIAHKGLNITDPNYHKLLVLDRLLASGGLQSVFMRELREKKGYTYAVSSKLLYHPVNAYIISLSTASDNAVEVIDEVGRIFREVKSTPFTAAEVEAAKSHLLDALLLRMDSSLEVLRLLSWIQKNDLTGHYIPRYILGIKEVDADSLNKFVQSFLDPDSVFFLNVGKPVEKYAGDKKVCVNVPAKS